MIKVKHKRFLGIMTLCLSLVSFLNVSAASASDLNSGNVVTLINQSRQASGLGSLNADPKLMQAAEMKANDMLAKQYFAHVGPDGNGPSYWAAQVGYNWTALGENIAYGYNTAESVHEAFMASSGHRANILGASYKDVGIAAVSGQFEGRAVIMVVEEFGATRNNTGDNTKPAPTPTPTPTPIPTYALTINSGTGSGSYGSGQAVSITANAPEASKVFDKWTGDTTHVSDANSATATVTMPSSPVSLTATYKDEATTPITSYALSVNNGTGSGSYTSGQAVSITADAPAEGKAFDKWTGDITCVSDANSATATVTMPSSAVSLTATYKDVTTPVTSYYLNVNGGTGDGWYAAGTQVTVTADAPTTGNVFLKWAGSTASVSDINSATATITMPSGDISLIAKYKRSRIVTGAKTFRCKFGHYVQYPHFFRTMLRSL